MAPDLCSSDFHNHGQCEAASSRRAKSDGFGSSLMVQELESGRVRVVVADKKCLWV